MENIGILIHIRLESTRLPEKHLKIVNDKYIIEYLVMRLKNKISNIDNIKIILNVSLTSKVKYDSILTNIKNKYNIELFYGDNDNIPLRILNCSKYHNLTHIISVDGDDIFTSPKQVKNIYDEFNKSTENNLLFTKFLPHGMNVFGFTFKLLEDNYMNVIESYDTGWCAIFNFDLVNLNSNDKTNIKAKNVKIKEIKDNFKYDNYDKLRFTLDYELDFNLLKYILENIDFNSTDEEIIKYANKNQLYNINKDIIDQWYNVFLKNKNNN